MKCSNCDQVLQNGSEFCGKCGSPVGLDGDSYSVLRPNISFSDAVQLGFKRYFDFHRRSSRVEYWWWALFTIIGVLALLILENIADIPGALSGIFRLATLIPSFAVGARRLHDINKSGWWQLMWLVGFLIVPIIVLLWWATRQSDEGTNKYGLNPREASSQ